MSKFSIAMIKTPLQGQLIQENIKKKSISLDLTVSEG